MLDFLAFFYVRSYQTSAHICWFQNIHVIFRDGPVLGVWLLAHFLTYKGPSLLYYVLNHEKLSQHNAAIIRGA